MESPVECGAAADRAIDKLLVILVHGTWAPNAAWVRPGSEFRKRMAASLGGDVQFREFIWSGRNSHAARKEAAQELSQFVQAASTEACGRRILLIGHSHGGNVAAYSLSDAEASKNVCGLVTLGTPFIRAEVSEEAALPTALTLVVGLFGLGLLGVVIPTILALVAILFASARVIGALEGVVPLWVTLAFSALGLLLPLFLLIRSYRTIISSDRFEAREFMPSVRRAARDWCLATVFMVSGLLLGTLGVGVAADLSNGPVKWLLMAVLVSLGVLSWRPVKEVMFAASNSYSHLVDVALKGALERAEGWSGVQLDSQSRLSSFKGQLPVLSIVFSLDEARIWLRFTEFLSGFPGRILMLLSSSISFLERRAPVGTRWLSSLVWWIVPSYLLILATISLILKLVTRDNPLSFGVGSYRAGFVTRYWVAHRLELHNLEYREFSVLRLIGQVGLMNTVRWILRLNMVHSLPYQADESIELISSWVLRKADGESPARNTGESDTWSGPTADSL